MKDEYAYGLIILLIVFVFSLSMYFSNMGYDAYETKERAAGIFWVIAVIGYIGIKVYYFIKNRK